MDYITFCKRFYAASGIPVSLLLDGKPVYASLAELLGYLPEESWTLYRQERNPEFASLSPDLEYGHIHVEGTGYSIFLGPVFTAAVNEKLIHEYFSEFSIPAEFREPLTELLYSLPPGSHPQFVRYLMFLHLVLNHKDIPAEEFYREDELAKENRSRRRVEREITDKEEEAAPSSYDFERQLYSLIAAGEPERLAVFLERTRQFPPEGKKAHTPLRQAKNTFIGLASKAAVLGAAAGGADIDRVYQLTDLYILECEQLQSLEEIHRLQYIMLIDFCQRAGESGLPAGISPEIRTCMYFIRRHTNTNLTIGKIAGKIHRSSSFLMHRFKAEAGMSVGEYITKCKMEEAASLLQYSERSLSGISAYLGYSSQPHFQKVFKNYYGLTPMQYRRRITGRQNS